MRKSFYLFSLSKEYHQALRRSLGRLHAFLFQQPTGMTRTVVPPVMTVNNNNNNNNISGGQPTRCSQHQSLQVGHGCPVRRHQRRSVFFFETSTLPPRIPPSGFRSARGISPVAQTPSNLLTDTITATNNPNTAKLRF